MRTAPTTVTEAISPTSISTPGWLANSIIVDNPGGQWVTLPDHDTIVGPFTVGVIVPTIGTQQVRVVVIPPSDQINTGRGNSATVILDSEQLAASSGTSIPGATTPDINSLGRYFGALGAQPGIAGQTFTVTIYNNAVQFDLWITRFDFGVIPNVSSAVPSNFEWELHENSTNSTLARGLAYSGSASANSLEAVRHFNPPIFIAAHTILALNVVCTRHDGATQWVANTLYVVTGVQYTTALQ